MDEDSTPAPLNTRARFPSGPVHKYSSTSQAATETKLASAEVALTAQSYEYNTRRQGSGGAYGVRTRDLRLERAVS